MGKRRWVLALLAVMALIVVGLGIRHIVDKQAANKRRIQYERQVSDYSAALKPGISRREVESYLQQRGIRFRQMCCVRVRVPRAAYADLVKIGQEKAPWYCNKYNIYVAFEFETIEPHGIVPDARSSDKLESTSLYPWLEECL
jgi:hypothetical protein